ncbi:MAG: hypothetical protein AAGC44_05175 [Planctomycetota bacterium]
MASTTIGKLRAIMTLNGSQYSAESDKLTQKMRRMDNAGEALSRRVRGIGTSMIASAVGFVGLGAAISRSIALGSDMQETVSRFNAVFRDNADEVNSWADQFTKAVGRSKMQTLDSLSSFQSFFVGLGFSSDRSSDLSIKLQQLAVDFASFNNLSDEDALGRFISAMSGSSEVLARYGINTKQAALEQELLAMGITKSWSQVTEQEKAIARLNIIMRSMTDQGAVGDAARTAGSFNNRMKAAKAAAEDMGVAVGSALLPVLTPMLQRIGAIAKAIAKVVEAAPGVVSAGSKFVILGVAMTGAAFAAVKIVGVTSAVVTAIRRIIAALEAGQAVSTGGLSLIKTLAGLAAAGAAMVGVGIAFSELEGDTAAAAEATEQLAKAEFDAAQAGGDMAEAFGAAAVEGQGAAQQIDQLQQRLDKLTMTSRELEIRKLVDAGATEAEMSKARELFEAIDIAERDKQFADKRLERMRDMADAARQVIERTRTPLERFNAEIERLNVLFERELIDPETLARAVADAKKQLEGVGQPESLRGIGALERGTAAAFSAVQESNRQQQQMAELAGIHREAQQINANLEQILGEPAVLIEEVDL